MKAATTFLIFIMIQQQPFKEAQLKHARVKTAYREKEAIIKKMFDDKELNQAGFQLFIRAFKKDEELEVWIKERDRDTYSLLHTYDFCTTSGVLGPKRKEGDLQIPEGLYHINHFNPVSNFYLSLGLNYPNASDKILSDKNRPGGSIYIHGNCVTIGCIPITDEKIKELYVLAIEARSNGQQNIPVHVFPTRLDDNGFDALQRTYADAPELLAFWSNLKTIYTQFESTKKVRSVKVNSDGTYQ
jgi:murein L,D-transpeptidase YafK